MDKFLLIEGVSMVFETRKGSFTALRDIDLAVAKGEFVSLIGHSGCGKSTLLNLVAVLLEPSGGILVLSGREIAGPGPDRGVVFQEYALLPWMTVIDNVALGPKLRGVPKDARHAIARRYLAMANLSDAETKYPHELSGGMKQRTAVARTLANEPEVMLMDEPFAAIDAQTRMTLQEELLRIWAQSRVTVLFVTHSVEEACFLGDRVAVLTPGPGRVKEIVAIDIPRERRNWATLGADPEFARIKERVLASVRGPQGASP